MFKKTITQLFIVAIVIGAIFIVNGFILAWSPPPGFPPDPNAPAPINVSPTTQTFLNSKILDFADLDGKNDDSLLIDGAFEVTKVFRSRSKAIFNNNVQLTNFTSCDTLGTDASGNLTCSGGGAPCAPDCSGRVCGADPVCGQSCGTCGVGYTCNASGQCEQDIPDYTYSYTGWVCGSCSGCEGTQSCTQQCQRSDGAFVSCSYCGGDCSKTESCGGPCYYWSLVVGASGYGTEVTQGALCSSHCAQGKAYYKTVCSDGENEWDGWKGQPGCIVEYGLAFCMEIGEHYLTNCW